MVYDDGLELSIPENPKYNTNFHVKSNKYFLMLTNGQSVKVGMKSNDLKMIFPKSFAKGVTVNDIKGKKGKFAITVYFSQVYDNKVVVEDSWIVFILSKSDGTLEEFYSGEPS